MGWIIIALLFLAVGVLGVVGLIMYIRNDSQLEIKEKAVKYLTNSFIGFMVVLLVMVWMIGLGWLR